jgi:hypothetical protein
MSEAVMATPFNDQWVLERAQRPLAPETLAAHDASAQDPREHDAPVRPLRSPAVYGRPRRERRLKWIDRDT